MNGPAAAAGIIQGLVLAGRAQGVSLLQPIKAGASVDFSISGYDTSDLAVIYRLQGIGLAGRLRWTLTRPIVVGPFDATSDDEALVLAGRPSGLSLRLTSLVLGDDLGFPGVSRSDTVQLTLQCWVSFAVFRDDGARAIECALGLA
ncbi:MAG: hypothetical protein DDT21_02427 [Syntrophomonadaceae bacterium]|nr:hypothetical protein [Bacillota bacterium]